MIGSFNCCYETPCGWCAKWDKKCDRKIGCDDDKPQRGLRVKFGIFYDDHANLELDDIRSSLERTLGHDVSMAKDSPN